MSKRKVVLRESVQWFAEQMELALRRNDHKGGWDGDLGYDVEAFLFEKLEEEADELGDAFKRGLSGRTKIREAADLGNIAMMLADRSRPGGASENNGRRRPIEEVEEVA